MKSHLYYNNELKTNARSLRKNMTDAEIRFWAHVRLKQLNGCQFYRQRIIAHYIVDFYCPRAKLVIELDGGQHLSEEGVAADRKRDEYLRRLGLKVLRFSDTDVLLNIEGVIGVVLEEMEILSPLNPPLKKGEKYLRA
jgi:very-short-patch-repair endonuclease